MARALIKENLPITLLILSLTFSRSSGADTNTPPMISLGVPYSGKHGHLILSEETPLNSYLGIMETKDGDNGPAGEVECRTDNPYIAIPLVYPKTYKIELAKSLDRETVNVFEVSIVCNDKGTPPLTTTAAITIEVTDVNDNAPIFGEAAYSANVTEGVKVGTYVLTVTSVDPDSEKFGVVHYSLQDNDMGGSSNFTVDEKTGQIFTKNEIDREVVDLYVVTIVARDSGVPALSSTVEVRIHVQDVNDNAPVILTTEIHVKENQKPMERVGKINATDYDIGKNAELVFSKSENSSSTSNTPFLVQANGRILSAVTLDREQRPQYVMEVAVRDKGNPRQSSTATIIIIIDDVNDNYPIIVSPCLDEDMDFSLDNFPELSNDSESGFVSIDWYSPEGNIVVFQIEAKDEDVNENSHLLFSIEPVTNINFFNTTSASTNDPLFKINEATGELFLRRFVRHNDPLTHILNMSVSDKGSPSLSAFCAIHVTINIDPAHLTTTTTTTNTTQKPQKVKTKPNKKLRKYKDGSSSVDLLGAHFFTRFLCVSVLCYTFYVHLSLVY